jgi:hypothetical protein
MKLTESDLDTNRLALLAVKVGGVIFAALIGISVGGGYFQNGILVILGIIALVLWFYSYEGFLLACVATLFLGGSNPSAPGGLRFFELMALLGVARLGLEQVVLRRRKLARGPTFEWYAILAFMSVVVWHAITSRMGMKILGSEVWGGRQYIGIFLGFALYVGFQTAHIDPNRWKWLPIAIVLPTSLDACLTLLRTKAPELTYFIGAVYDVGSDEGVSTNPLQMGARLGQIGTAGLMIVLAVLAYRRVGTLFTPRPSTLAFLTGGVLILVGSFRSSVLSAGLMFVAASVRDMRLRAIFPIGAIVGAIVFLTFAHGTILRLPEQAQRALAFMPGNWDPQVLVSSNSSDDFRRDMWAKWREKYFPLNPWFGRGFGFSPSDLAMWQFSLADQNVREALLVTQELHNGFFSSLDCVGIAGTAFLILWALLTLRRCIGFFLKKDRSIDNPALRWLALYLLSFTLLFWVGALKLSGFLTIQFVLTGLFVRLDREVGAQASGSDQVPLDLSKSASRLRSAPLRAPKAPAPARPRSAAERR